MNQKTPGKQNLSRRKITLLLTLLVCAVIATLLYFEQVAVLYVLSTLGLVILLLVVAFADLEKVGQNDEKTASPETAASSSTVQSGTMTETAQNRITNEQNQNI